MQVVFCFSGKEPRAVLNLVCAVPVVSVLQHLGGPARETGSLCPAGPSEHQPQFPPSFPDQPFSVLSDSISVLKLSSDGPIQICILYITLSVLQHSCAYIPSLCLSLSFLRSMKEGLDRIECKFLNQNLTF